MSTKSSYKHCIFRNKLANEIAIVIIQDSVLLKYFFVIFADNKEEMEIDREICTNTDQNFDENKKELQKAAASQLTEIDQQIPAECGSYCSNTQEDCSNTQEDSMPASPGTRALLCDEQDLTFGTAYRSSIPVVLHDQDISELQIAQENAVLRAFRNYLRLIIARGQVNGEMSF